MRKKLIKTFLVISALIALADAIFVYMNYRLAESAFHTHLEKESETLNLNFETLLAQTYSSMQSFATYIANDEQVQSLFLQGKKAVEREGGGAGGEQAAIFRKQLYDLVSPNWSEVQRNFSARQLHFHLGPGSTSFLRVHKPAKFGDNMDNVRFTIVDTNREKKPRVGFETGRVYSGLRGVVPVQAVDSESNTTVDVGALEVGTSFQVLLDIIDKTSNFGSGVLLTKNHIDSAMWPESIPERFNNLTLTCGCVVEASSRDGFEDIILAAQNADFRFRDKTNRVIEANDRSYLVSSSPLRDYLGELDEARDNVGAVVFWRDVSDEVANLKASQNYNILFGIVGFLFVELLFFIALRFGTQRLQKVIDQDTKQLRTLKDRLSSAQSIAQLGNWEWNIANGELWWSDETYNVFGLRRNKVTASYKTFLKCVHPEDRKKVKTNINYALKNNAQYQIEHRVLLPDGSEKVVEEKGKIDRDKAGTPLKMVGTVRDITSQKQAEAAIKARETIYRQMFELNTAIKLLIDPKSGQIIQANKSACEFYGYTPKQILDLTIFDINTLDKAQIQQEMQTAMAENRRFYRFKHRHANGNVRDVEVHTGPVDVDDSSYLYSVITDVTDRNTYERTLLETTKELKSEREKLKRAANVFSHAQEGIIITNAKGKIIETNKAFTDITGFSEDEVIGQNPRILTSGRQSKDFYRAMWRELGEKGCWQGEVWNKSKLGNFFAESLTITAVKDDFGKVINYVGIFSDITVQKQKEEDLRKHANYDALTTLPNRRMLQTSLEKKLSDRRHANIAILYIDLDGFKPVNDQHGHQAGDELLIAVGQIFTSQVRSKDIVARVGGDEFVIVIDDISSITEAEAFAARTLEALSAPIPSNFGELKISASIGVLFIDKSNEISVHKAISLADSNMYQAKHSGKNGYFATAV